ncbi:hypothetical protein Leryth_005794 [Lithospermum erythrorhizon]|nr:hypothetical protein Leryth_005794 [Lithospermum erythrorhizon]
MPPKILLSHLCSTFVRNCINCVLFFMDMSINHPSFATSSLTQLDNKSRLHEKVDIFSRKPRFLCLHGFRTSGEILKRQILGKWPSSITEKLDLVFVDGPFLAQGKSDVEGFFDPPYYEWYQATKDFTEYINFEECLAYIEDCMVKYGPFDGFLGFSQGAILSAALPGLQAKGMALAKVDKIKVLIIIGGAKSRNPSIAENAYSPKIQCPSVHFLGERDFLKNSGIELLESFINPVVIHHPKGHTIPSFDEENLVIMHEFIERIQKQVTGEEEQTFPENA